MATRKNPFIENFTVRFVRHIKRDVPLNKELEEGDFYDVEAEKCSRVYRKLENLADLMIMKHGSRLFLWMLYRISEDAISVKLDDKNLAMELKCSERTVERMRAELLEAAVIAKKQYNEYWVNPRFFASDNRLKLFPGHTLQVALVRDKY
jgi:hypothetical protein